MPTERWVEQRLNVLMDAYQTMLKGEIATLPAGLKGAQVMMASRVPARWVDIDQQEHVLHAEHASSD